ncbi:MAG: sugar phosphate isomerase/epimerase family protein [Phycisphaeraceae bacterium]
MVIVTHGSDLSLAPTLTPIVRHVGGTVRAGLERIAGRGFATVQLDATLHGIRPRELDRQARRELLGVVRRRNLRLGGVDLFIPRKHYLEADHVDRAMSATVAAIELAADLGRVPLSLTLPVRQLPVDLASAIVEAADGHSVRVAVHAEDQLDALQAWVEEVDLPALGAAIDPAALLARGHDPAQVAQRFGAHLTVARLSDVARGSVEEEADDPTLSQGGGESVRCTVGAGELDLLAYRVALDLAAQRAGPVVLDLRGLSEPMRAAEDARRAWDDAAVSF